MESQPMDRFDRATAVTELGGGRFGAVLEEDYAVIGNPNGGYLLAVLASAAAAQLRVLGVDHPHCVAASASFARPPACGEVEIELEVHRLGSSVSQLRATVRQGGEVAVDALLSCGRLEPADAPRYETACDVVLPPVESCERRPAGGLEGISVAIMDRVELLLDPATAGFAHGQLSDEAEVRGWLRLADGRRMDPLAMLFALDVLPPATFPIGSLGWVPTLQLCAFVRAIPADGWLVARQRARTVRGGYVDELCELWDADGHAVGQSTQLARVRFP